MHTKAIDLYDTTEQAYALSETKYAKIGSKMSFLCQAISKLFTNKMLVYTLAKSVNNKITIHVLTLH